MSLRSPTAIGAVLLVTAGSLCSISYQTPTISLLQNMVGTRMRATAAFVFFFIGALIGHGLGPPLFGFVSDLMAARSFGFGDYQTVCPGGLATAGASPALQDACVVASAAGLTDGAWLIGALFVAASSQFYLASRTVARDIAQPSPTSPARA
jgi:hypothetical protein